MDTVLAEDARDFVGATEHISDLIAGGAIGSAVAHALLFMLIQQRQSTEAHVRLANLMERVVDSKGVKDSIAVYDLSRKSR